MFRSKQVLVASITIAFLTIAGMGTNPIAHAEVVHGIGFNGTVAGWTSWYGSYVLADHGHVWCVDHGLHAPDGVFGYQPSSLPDTSESNQVAMAWALGTYGIDPTPIDAAALMLVLHDLNGAIYPQGPLDVEHLTTAQLAGFNGAESAILQRAQSMNTDARAHSALRGPLSLTLTIPVAPASETRVRVELAIQDRNGRPVQGVPIRVSSNSSPQQVIVTSAPDGSASILELRGENPRSIEATADIPELGLMVFGPSGAPAQRIGIPNRRHLSALGLIDSPPTTTSTTSTTSTTTSSPAPTLPPTTTTTTPPATTTTAPLLPTTTTTSTTTPPNIPTTSLAPPTSDATQIPVSPPVPPPPSRSLTPVPSSPPEPTLPSTGAADRDLAILGLGLFCTGSGLVFGLGRHRGPPNHHRAA